MSKPDSITGVFTSQEIASDYVKFLQDEGYDIIVPSLDTVQVPGETYKGSFNLEDVDKPNFELPDPFRSRCEVPLYAVVGGKPIHVEGGIGSSDTQVIWTHTLEDQQKAVDKLKSDGYTVFVPTPDERTLEDIAREYGKEMVTGDTEHITIDFTEVKDCLEEGFPNSIDINPSGGEKFVYVVVAEAKGKG